MTDSREEPRAEPGCELPESLNRQREEERNEQVEEALLWRCLGYNTPVVKHYKLKTVEYDPTTGKKVREEERLVEAQSEVHVPAQTTAQVFWLSNRRPSRWRGKAQDREGAEEDEEEGGVIIIPEVVPEVGEDG